jgi:hypothetical protein
VGTSEYKSKFPRVKRAVERLTQGARVHHNAELRALGARLDQWVTELKDLVCPPRNKLVNAVGRIFLAEDFTLAVIRANIFDQTIGPQFPLFSSSHVSPQSRPSLGKKGLLSAHIRATHSAHS